MPDQQKYSNKLKGAKVLVIGGSSGIGYAIAEALLEHGAAVTISSSNEGRVSKTILRLKEAYPSAHSRINGFACDLGKESTLETNVARLFEQTGPLNHVIHTAGDALAVKPLPNADLEFIKQAGMVRFFSALIVGKYAPRYLEKSPSSSITFTTGVIAERPIPDWTIINSYATGQQGMVRGMALDLKPIRVNLIAPGVVNTELWANAGMSRGDQDGFLESHVEKTTTRLVAGPETIAEAYLYVLKDTNVTGTTIHTNGGTLLT